MSSKHLTLAVIFALLAASSPGCKKDEEQGSTEDAASSTSGTASTEETTADGTETGSDDGGTGTDVGPAGDLCDACETDGECGASSKCVPDARGDGFCSRSCGYFGDSACPADYYCKQFGNNTTDFYCSPLEGLCVNDGQDCSPCRTEGDDCKPGLFCFEPLGDIAFCVRSCEGAGTCPSPGMECGHHDKVEGSICLPKISGVPTAKCGARPLAFCEPCTTAGQCQTGVCEESPNIGSICSKPCDGDTDCPSGTDCVHSVCVPPIAHGCQGFLSCLGVECDVDEICHKGFCMAAP